MGFKLNVSEEHALIKLASHITPHISLFVAKEPVLNKKKNTKKKQL